jgi:emfourin
MRVKFMQSGGIVGALRGCDLDSARLEPDDARELESLVGASGIIKSGESLAPGARDLRVYEIQVESEAINATVTFDDETLPEQARPLVSFLRRNAKPQAP